MLTSSKQFFRRASNHRYGFTLAAYIAAAVLTGMACVLFMRAFEFVTAHQLTFHRIGWWCLLTSPLLFLASVELVRRVAPAAEGTGIPQVIFAIKNWSLHTEKALTSLTSHRTLIVKILALLIALWAGASTGREGPTVHVATCIFVGLLLLLRRLFGFDFDMRSAMVAGGAAGLAAAFNTPLAGVVFAIEELTVESFGAIKDYVIMAIVIAALSARTLYGEYSYFGRLLGSEWVPITITLLIGITGGLAGALFSTTLVQGKRWLARYREGWTRYLVPLVLALGVLGIAAVSAMNVMGAGNEAAQTLTRGTFGSWAYSFPATKLLATLFTYWSGVAGGIFAPCLSIGAAIGADIGQWTGLSTASCAMIGMAAFLSGTIQAPITSFVIIFEMTGNHVLLVPIMLSSLTAFMVNRVLGVPHLYPTLALNYAYLLGKNAPEETEAKDSEKMDPNEKDPEASA